MQAEGKDGFVKNLCFLKSPLDTVKEKSYNINEHLLNRRSRGEILRTVNEEARRVKIIKIMETAFNCYAENGFTSVGVKAIADACGCNVASLYQYFENPDDIIVKSAEYCMSKVEDEFYLKSQIDVLKETLELFIMKYNPKIIS